MWLLKSIISLLLQKAALGCFVPQLNEGSKPDWCQKEQPRYEKNKQTLDLENSVLWFIKILNQNKENDILLAHLREQCHSSISGSNLGRKGTTAPAAMLLSQFQFTSNNFLSKRIISRGPLKRKCVLKSALCKNHRFFGSLWGHTAICT